MSASPFTRVQYDAAIHLNDFLTKSRKGGVYLVQPFRYHGKLYSFSKNKKPFACIIGSDNLSSITEGGIRSYESSVLFDEPEFTQNIQKFISDLQEEYSRNIADLEITEFNVANQLLEGIDNVKKYSAQDLADLINAKTEVTFNIPIKTSDTAARSNLNAYFGKGRQSPNGLIKPRHWYEVELIVSNKITSLPEYPCAQSFTVVTDDGWSFQCKTSGDFSKNFRSEHDLKILGRWLKGRLENAGSLRVGEPVSPETLERYGRSYFSLTKTSIPNTWYIDFNSLK